MAGKLLEGARILDLSRMLTGGFGAMLLGDQGAEVIKIEPPGVGDPLRKMPPHFVEGESAYFLSINRSKKSVTLDLRAPEGREAFHALVRESDVVFDNFRPGILEKLGADYETLKGINPGIICCSILSFGTSGPYAEQPAFDLTIQALSGAMSYTGEPDRLPVRMGIPMGDLAGSLYAAFSISAALYHRDKTGEGRKIELSLLDCLISLHTYVSQYYFSGGEISGPIGSGHLSVVPYRAFATRDKPLVIAIFVEKFWKVLCDTIGDPELGEDPRLASSAGRLEHREEVDSRVQAKLLEKTREEWLELLREAQVPCAPILSIDEVFEDPQVKHDEMRIETEHPHCGALPVTGDPIKQTPKPDGGFVPSPLLGQHTDEVLTDLAGLSRDQIEKLREKKIV